MKLQDKIKEIQNKPEHIRMRYVWGCVAVSMFFILTLWVFSMTAGRTPRNAGGLSEGQILEQFKVDKNSIQDYTNQLKDMQGTFKDLQNQVQQAPPATDNQAQGQPVDNSGNQ